MKALKNLLTMVLTMLVLVSAVSAVDLSANPTAVIVNEGDDVTVTLTATTGVGDYTYSINSHNLPSSGTLISNVFTWTPDYTESGDYSVTFKVVDETLPTAEEDTVTVTITVNDYNPLTIEQDILLGGENQYRSNPDADDEDRQEVYAEETFTITNNGGLPVDITSLTSTASTGYDVTFEDVPSSIAAGTSVIVTVKGYVPEDLNSFFPDRADFDDRRNDLGIITVTSSTEGILPVTSELYMEAENLLDFDRLYVFVDGDDEKISEDDEQIDNIRLGDIVIVEARAENLYDDNDNANIDIEDIEMTVVIEDSDLDVDEDVDFGDLEAKETSDLEEIEFEIDREDANDQKYDMYIILTGEDANGARMGKKYLVVLEVEKKNDEIAIFDAEISPSYATCKQSATIEFTLVNIGSDDQKEVSYKVDNPQLNLLLNKVDLRIDEGDEETYVVTVPLDGVEAGEYFIEITAYVDDDEPTDSTSVTLIVECDDEVDTGLDDITGDVVQPPLTVVPELEDGFQNSTVYLMLLGGLVLALSSSLIVMLVKYVL